MKTIINNENSFKETKAFIQKYFQNVRVVKNKNSHLAKKSQSYYKTILFENRGSIFSLEWNHYSCTLFFGDITVNKKTCIQYSFTKMRIDTCYPIEDGNNSNVMFWEFEIISSHDEIGNEISPLRLPVTLRS